MPQLLTTPFSNRREETLLGRKAVVRLLRISHVALTDWVKHGVPAHNQRYRRKKALQLPDEDRGQR